MYLCYLMDNLRRRQGEPMHNHLAPGEERWLRMRTHTPRRFFRTLYFRVIVGIVLGVLVGIFAPHAGEQLKPLGDVFIKLIRMMITPVIFFTVVIGIANIGSTRRLGRVGVKALVYFEVVTTFPLLFGLAFASIFHPASGSTAYPP